MNVEKLAIFGFIFLLTGFAICQGNFDDKSFVGYWLETSDGSFVRVDTIKKSEKGFLLTEHEVLSRQSNCRGDSLCYFYGGWWSFGTGHFDIQYENHIDRKEIIERFEYVGNVKDEVKRVGYEEYPLMKDTDFLGYWKLIVEDTSDVIYEKCNDIESEEFAFQINDNGSGKIFKTKSNNERITMEFMWWLGEDGNYIGMRFYNSLTDLLNIEGFTAIPFSNPIRIRRTRFDAFSE